MNMFREVLRAQWKWSWGTVLIAAVCAFSIPIASVQRAVLVPAARSGTPDNTAIAEHFLTTMDKWGVFYTLIAAGLGLGLAIMAWSADHRGRHVYALILPVERWRLVLLRFMSGTTLLLVPAFALLVGSLLAAASVVIPDGLNPYPVALTFRFLLAAWVSYALFFAISAGTTRTAAFVLAPIALVITTDAMLGMAGIPFQLGEATLMAIFEWPGVMEVFTGRWLLIDV